jgi:hypothetical protein
VKEEDADWLVYHLIPQDASVSREALAASSGLDRAALEACLGRLERYSLVGCSGNSVRVLTLAESLVRNQIRHEKDLPYTIENGVIKARKP